MANQKDKKLLGFTVLAILAAGTVYNGVNWFLDYQYKQSIIADHEDAVEDENTGSVVYGYTATQILDELLVTETICGKRVTLKESVMKKCLAANSAMEAAYESRTLFKKGDKHRCILINTSFRPNREQSGLYEDSWTDIEGNPCTDKKGKQVQCWKAAKPGLSFHEIGQAIDVQNFAQAEPFLLEQGLIGGWHGIYKDPWHFSQNEGKRKGWKDDLKQRKWHLEVWLKRKFKK